MHRHRARIDLNPIALVFLMLWCISFIQLDRHEVGENAGQPEYILNVNCNCYQFLNEQYPHTCSAELLEFIKSQAPVGAKIKIVVTGQVECMHASRAFKKLQTYGAYHITLALEEAES